jgi:hypothetical protein
MEDLVAGSVKYGDDPQKIEEAFGTPDSRNSYQEGATGNDVLEYFYSSGNEFVFISDSGTDSFFLKSVRICTTDVATARGLKVGCTQEDVIESFRNDGTDARILYAAEIWEIDDDFTMIIPPRGLITDDPAGTCVNYSVPVYPYTDREEVSGYMYQSHGNIWFIITDSVVVEYGWFVGAMAE